MTFRRTLTTAALTALVIAGGCFSRDSPTGPGAPGVGAIAGAAADSVVLLEDFSNRQVFPADNWWHLNVSAAPVDPQSSALIAWISGRVGGNTTAVRALHPDFGPPPYGIPYAGVGGTQALVPITFTLYGNQSDVGAREDRPVIRFPTLRGPRPASSKETSRAADRAATVT